MNNLPFTLDHLNSDAIPIEAMISTLETYSIAIYLEGDNHNLFKSFVRLHTELVTAKAFDEDKEPTLLYPEEIRNYAKTLQLKYTGQLDATDLEDMEDEMSKNLVHRIVVAELNQKKAFCRHIQAKQETK